MRMFLRRAALAALLLTGSTSLVVHAQTMGQAQPMPVAPAPEFRYPEQGAPSSTLRMREIPQTGSWGQGQAPRPVTDTPESLELYQLCQREADRAATDIPDMQSRIAGCLNALNQRREQGR